MKKHKFKTIFDKIKNGKIEAITDLQIGFVAIRNLSNNKKTLIQVI